MSSRANPFPPNPSLVAVLLVIKSGTGPVCVLHYPPEATHAGVRGKGKQRDHRVETSSGETSDAAGWSDGSDVRADPSDDLTNGVSIRRGRQRGSSDRTSRKEHARSSLRHQIGATDPAAGESKPTGPSGSGKVRAAEVGSEQTGAEDQDNRVHVNKSLVEKSHYTLLDYSTDSLAKLLSPTNRRWHKRRLEVTLGEYCLIGCPMFCREDGRWEKPPRRKQWTKKSKQGSTGGAEKFNEEDEEAGDEREETTATEGEESTAESGAGKEAASVSGDPKQSIQEPPLSSISSTPSSADLHRNEDKSQTPHTLQVFNVVFVLCPPALEHQMRVRELYVNVVKTLSAALRHQQQRESYVSNEARTLYLAREKALEKGLSLAEAWPTIAAESSLARALATTFDCISTSQIAHISLGESLDVSLQIPQALSTAHVSTPQNPQIPGLWLTSADLTASHDGTYGTTISPQSALLLLVSPETLTRELTLSSTTQKSQSADFAAPLAYFIRHCNPTKTLSQLSKKLRVSLPDLQFLSVHLIRWRRARAISPLHPSNIYVPSPNADTRELPVAREQFRRHFTAVPDLVTVLAKLGDTKSNAPRPWSVLVPSTEHKGMYMDVLAWLVRGGWVCQIRTFAWVVVKPDVKRAVDKAIRRQERGAREALATASLHENVEEETIAEDHSVDNEADGGSGTKRRLSNESSRTNTQALFSPRMRATLFPPKPSSVAGSVSSGQTAVRISNAPGSDAGSHLKEQTDSKDHSRHPSNETGEEDDAEIDQREYETSVVLSPHKASSLESRWLEHIGKSLPDEDLRRAWPSLVKYFDGQHAIEEIAIREDKKRKLVNPLLIRLMGQYGVLRTVRHW